MPNTNSLQNRKSRYVQGGVTETANNRLEWWEKINFPSDPSDITYVVENFYEGRADLIAATFYDNPKLWWVIAQFNNILDPAAELVAGRILTIPTKQRVEQFMVSKLGGVASKRSSIKSITKIIV